jgi:hypothetical protein
MRWKKSPMADGPAAAALPPVSLHISTLIWNKDTPIHRVHQDRYAAAQFNPGLKGNARFSPIRDQEGRAIPSLYGGSSFECAAMETVFHDVSFAPGFKAYDKSALSEQVHSQIHPTQDLLLADLGSKALRKLGVQRKQLIDTETDQYPLTRQWAEAIHAAHAQIQGLCWTSRQDDEARAIVLFGDRIGPGVLQQLGASRSLLGDPAAYSELLDLAEKIGVDIVPGKR